MKTASLVKTHKIADLTRQVTYKVKKYMYILSLKILSTTYTVYNKVKMKLWNISDQFSRKRTYLLLTCSEFEEVKTCFDLCNSNLSAEEVKEVEGYLEFKSMKRLNNIFCEGRYTPGHASKYSKMYDSILNLSLQQKGKIISI